MNRTALGLAVGAGYFLGRTKKLKMALGVGSLVAGKKLNLGPRTLADVVNRQLKNNPHFKEIGDQLRQDLRGVGKAASGAMVERQINALADRLHDRTAQVRDELSGAGSGEDRDEDDDRDEQEDGNRAERGGGDHSARGDSDRESRREKPPGKKAAKKPPVKKAAKKAPAKKAPAKKIAAKKAAPAKKAVGGSAGTARRTAAKKTTGARGAGSSKGGDDR